MATKENSNSVHVAVISKFQNKSWSGVEMSDGIGNKSFKVSVKTEADVIK